MTRCETYKFPTWLNPWVTTLWVIFGCLALVSIFILRFFWIHQKCRRAIFRLKSRGENKPKVEKAYETEYCDLFCCRRNKNRYDFSTDFWDREIKNKDVKFGHKIFRLPIFGSKWLKRRDNAMTPKEKLRLIFQFFETTLKNSYKF